MSENAPPTSSPQTGPHPLADTVLVDVDPAGGIRISLEGLKMFHTFYAPLEPFNWQLAIWTLGCHLLEQSGLTPQVAKKQAKRRR